MTADIAARAPETVTLRDGRTLAYYTYGDPAGSPCVYVPGSPLSGVFGAVWDERARGAGIRWISVDKPGYGHSTLDPRPSLSSAAADLVELLDALDVPRAPFVGESGGAPHVVALAHDAPERVTTAFVIAGMGPASEAWARTAMRPMNRRAMWMARRAPFLLRLVMSRIAGMDRAAYTSWMRKEAPAADAAVLDRHPELLDHLYHGSHQAFRQGPRAAAQEMAMFARPWHFSIDDVTVPVRLWHGSDDVNVPVAIANEVVRRLPDCRAHIVEGEGHLLSVEHRDEIIAEIVGSAS